MRRLALLSVSDKTGLIELAQQLVQEFQFDLISSGGTLKHFKRLVYQSPRSATIQVRRKSSVAGLRPFIPRFMGEFWLVVIYPNI
jgi:hypothetical protein